jgi:hypothetical protein
LIAREVVPADDREEHDRARFATNLKPQQYTVTSECHIAGPPNAVDYQDDQAAVIGTKQALDGQSIEIWNGSRLVARLNPQNGAPSTKQHTDGVGRDAALWAILCGRVFQKA